MLVRCPKCGKEIYILAAARDYCNWCGYKKKEKECVFDNLQEVDEETKKRIQKAVREGKIEIAPSIDIEQYEDLADLFVEKIFDIKGGCLVTDESSLYDFTDFGSGDIQPYLEKIKKEYGVDVSDIEGLNLAKVLQRISILGC